MENTDPQKEINDKNTYLRFSSIAIQMGVIIGGGAYAGSALDKHYRNETPIWTIICSLAGIGIGLYLVIREVLNISKKND
jgi:F0F1-type ATP synthase assembly protein I